MSLRHPAIFRILLTGLLSVFPAQATYGQIDGNASQPAAQAQSASTAGGVAEPVDKPKYLLKHLAQDQVTIWTSPFRARIGDLKWLVPAAGITAGLIETDRTASHEARRFIKFKTNTFSDAGLAAAAASSVGFYALGWRNGNRQQRETGTLIGEAMADSLVVSEALKYTFQRQIPTENNGTGRFFETGSQRAFPSNHAILSFAAASVVAHEYNGWFMQSLAYGGATAISLARVTGGDHFPSDIFVGGALGYLIGRQVYRAHHDPDLSPDYGTFVKTSSGTGTIDRSRFVNVSNAGSSYVELDSWIYPAMERLIALNVIRRPFLGLRPWPRTAIAEMLAEAQPVAEDSNDPQITETYSALKTEFSQELGLVDEGDINQNIGLESVYARINPIAGTPLNDSYHFGQTIINDYGRPYWQGFNAVSGFTSRAEAGQFFFYTRGEYQTAPGAPAYSNNVRTLILQIDQNCQFNGLAAAAGRPCSSPAGPVTEANQFRLLDTYAGFSWLGHELTIGKQSLWWGPDEGSASIFSDNAEPLYMARLNRTLPLRIPLLSRLLGPVRYDSFFGKTAETNFPANPFIYGNKVSFQPTDNLEIGFSRTAIFAGQGHQPLTLGELIDSNLSINDVTQAKKLGRNDPGARHGSFDFSYKVPFVRKWLTIYADALAHDEPNPVAAPRRASVVPGFYLSRFPKLHKLDLRVESGYTDIPTVRLNFQQGGHFLYFEQIYHNAYTNKGDLFGSWIGRDGKGTQAWSNYWLNANSAIQLSYRNLKDSAQFIPGGTTQNDFSAGLRLRLHTNMELLTSVQYEHWSVPVLATNQQSDVATSVQFTFWPQDWLRRKPN